ncbi:MAG: lysozyme inhibitor LprI family protein [Neisseria sp.]
MGSKSNDLDLSKFKPQPYASVEEAEQKREQETTITSIQKPIMTSPLHSLLIVFAVGILSCSTAVAEVPSRSVAPSLTDLHRLAYKTCMNNANSRIEHGSCMADEQAFQNEQLQKSYKDLSKSMNTKQRNTLEKSQAAWEVSTLANAALGIALLDPSGLDLSVTDNTILLIIQRRQMLEHLTNLIR